MKFLVASLANLERRLLTLQARLIQARTHELNLRFDTSDGAFMRSGRVLRLRRDALVRLTYKDPGRVESGALSRREIELTVDDFDSARALLLALDYQVVFIYEKYRTTYALNDVELMLDQLPYGDFIEIEGESTALPRAAEQIGLDWTAAIPRSYHDLFQRIRAERGLPFRDLTFENFAGLAVKPAELGVRPADT